METANNKRQGIAEPMACPVGSMPAAVATERGGSPWSRSGSKLSTTSAVWLSQSTVIPDKCK